jgi:hypothetical protein
MGSMYLRILCAIGFSLMCVLIGSGHDGRNSTKGRSVPVDEAAKNAVLDQNFKVKYDKDVAIKGQNLKVKLDSVLEDSRCPKDVKCVWAGDAKIMLSVRRGNGEASTMELHTNGQFAQTGKYQQYVIKLVALDPYPRTSAKLKPSDYVATLLITKE